MHKIQFLPCMPSSKHNGIFRMNFIEIPAIPGGNMARCPQVLCWPHDSCTGWWKAVIRFPKGTVDFAYNTQQVLWLIVWHCTHSNRSAHTHSYTQTPPCKGTAPGKTPSSCITPSWLSVFSTFSSNLHKDSMKNPNSEFSLLARQWKVVDLAILASGQPILGPLKLLLI